MMTNRLPKYIAWSVLLVIVIVTICPIGFRPHTLTTVGIDRAAAFAFCSAAFGIEALQFLSPTRHPHLMDAAVKAAGAIAGGLAALSYLQFRSRLTAASVIRHSGLEPE